MRIVAYWVYCLMRIVAYEDYRLMGLLPYEDCRLLDLSLIRFVALCGLSPITVPVECGGTGTNIAEIFSCTNQGLDGDCANNDECAKNSHDGVFYVLAHVNHFC